MKKKSKPVKTKRKYHHLAIPLVLVGVATYLFLLVVVNHVFSGQVPTPPAVMGAQTSK